MPADDAKREIEAILKDGKLQITVAEPAAPRKTFFRENVAAVMSFLAAILAIGGTLVGSCIANTAAEKKLVIETNAKRESDLVKPRTELLERQMKACDLLTTELAALEGCGCGAACKSKSYADYERTRFNVYVIPRVTRDLRTLDQFIEWDRNRERAGAQSPVAAQLVRGMARILVERIEGAQDFGPAPFVENELARAKKFLKGEKARASDPRGDAGVLDDAASMMSDLYVMMKWVVAEDREHAASKCGKLVSESYTLFIDAGIEDDDPLDMRGTKSGPGKPLPPRPPRDAGPGPFGH